MVDEQTTSLTIKICLTCLKNRIKNIKIYYTSSSVRYNQKLKQIQMLEDLDIMTFYYFLNKFWLDFNLFFILPFLVSCINRYLHPDINKVLLTDHIARVLLIVCCIFYLFDMIVKYPVDGADSICEKAFFVHHCSSLVLFPILFMNRYIPWWVDTICVMHGFCIYWPESDLIKYSYPAVLFIYHYQIYQQPYCNLRGYKISQFFMNFIWIFCLFVVIGNCSNYLPTGPE